MTDPAATDWRYFQTREVALARDWAAQGGIAVHENLVKFRGRHTCHLLAIDEVSLIEAAVSVGCSARWIHRTRTIHFDLVEIHLERALVRCGISGALIRSQSISPSTATPAVPGDPPGADGDHRSAPRLDPDRQR